MDFVPAICDKCGTIFSSGFPVGRGTTLFEGNKAGPCPNCRSMGHVPDGVYSFVDGAIKLLQGPERTVSELKRLSVILQSVKTRGATREEVRAALKDELREISEIGDVLPKTRAELYAFITLLIAIITLLIAPRKKGETPKIETHDVINTVIRATKSAPSARKVGRNEPCPCKSGKKFKHCHGDLLGAQVKRGSS